MALDRTTAPDTILVGEYRADSNGPIRMAKWELDWPTRKLIADGNTAKATWAYCVGIERMQGAFSANGRIYISRRNGSNGGDIWGWVPGDIAYNNGGLQPTSPGDLSYDKRGEKLYDLTKEAGRRYVFTLDTASIKTGWAEGYLNIPSRHEKRQVDTIPPEALLRSNDFDYVLAIAGSLQRG